MPTPYFDVRTKTTSPQPIPDSIATRSINLMCAILDGITYGELYDTTFHDDSDNSILDRLIVNANNLHRDLQIDASGNVYNITAVLAGNAGVFVQIRTILEATGYPKFDLKELFTTKIYGGITTRKKLVFQIIVGLLEEVHTPPPGSNEDRMYHFCVPFLTIQKERVPSGSVPPKSSPNENDIDYFIDNLGDLEMKDFYQEFVEQPNKPTRTKRREVSKHALAHCIFKEYGRPHKPLIVAGADGNNMHCEEDGNGGHHCVTCGGNPATHPEHWCNDYVQGNVNYCTLGSDYHT